MEKPFDGADLAAKLKAKGLPILEDTAEVVVKEVIAWMKESFEIHPQAVVKAIGIAAVGVLEPLALGAVDKIDGQEG